MRRTLLALMLVLALFPTTANAYTRTQRHHRAVIRSELRKLHVSKSEIRAALIIGFRESGWNPRAKNGSCKGAFQLMTSFPRSKWSDLRWNTRKANRYVHHRYGSWRGALAHSYRRGWY